jgi:hypothetical protein
MTDKTIDLKNTHNSSNNEFMRPKLHEENIPKKESIRPRLLESDIHLLANPKKTKKMTSSSEEESNSSMSDVSTEISDEDIGLSQDPNELLGRNFDPFSKENSQDDDDGDDGDDDNDDGDDDDDDDDGDNNTTSTVTSTSSNRKPPQRAKTLEEIAAEKQELLYRLERLEANGFKASRKFNMSSNLDDIKFEYERMKKQRDVDKSIKFQRKILMAITSGIEFVNNKFDPLSVKLDGWSESIYENLHEYDDIFEELHEKYKSKMKVAPELKLMMMVGGSAFMFHLTNTLFKSKMPGLDQILQQNPELARNVQQAAMNTMRQNETNSGNQDPLFGMMMNSAQNMMGPKPQMGGNPMGGNPMGGNPMGGNPMGGKQTGNSKGQLRGPSGVDDILNMVNRPKVPKEDTISSVSTQGSGEKKKIRMKKQSMRLNFQ